LDSESTDREVHMLKLLANMVDAFNACKFVQAHIVSVDENNCPDCLMVAVLLAFSTDGEQKAYKEAMCQDMQKAIQQIAEGERIARNLAKSFDQLEKKYSHD